MNFEVEYGGGKHIAVAGLDALMVYEQEFGTDLIKDVYGVVEVTEDDVAEALDVAKDGIVLTLDFTKVNWTKIVKAIWACLKSYDPTIPSFDKWVKQTTDMNIMDAKNSALPAFEESFFPTRNGDAEKEADNSGEPA